MGSQPRAILTPVSVRWESYERTGQSVEAMAGDRRVGQVVRYDVPEGWAAFLTGERVPGGPWATVEEAQAALEAAWGGRAKNDNERTRP